MAIPFSFNPLGTEFRIIYKNFFPNMGDLNYDYLLMPYDKVTFFKPVDYGYWAPNLNVDSLSNVTPYNSEAFNNLILGNPTGYGYWTNGLYSGTSNFAYDYVLEPFNKISLQTNSGYGYWTNGIEVNPLTDYLPYETIKYKKVNLKTPPLEPVEIYLDTTYTNDDWGSGVVAQLDWYWDTDNHYVELELMPKRDTNKTRYYDSTVLNVNTAEIDSFDNAIYVGMQFSWINKGYNYFRIYEFGARGNEGSSITTSVSVGNSWLDDYVVYTIKGNQIWLNDATATMSGTYSPLVSNCRATLFHAINAGTDIENMSGSYVGGFRRLCVYKDSEEPGIREAVREYYPYLDNINKKIILMDRVTGETVDFMGQVKNIKYKILEEEEPEPVEDGYELKWLNPHKAATQEATHFPHIILDETFNTDYYYETKLRPLANNYSSIVLYSRYNSPRIDGYTLPYTCGMYMWIGNGNYTTPDYLTYYGIPRYEYKETSPGYTYVRALESTVRNPAAISLNNDGYMCFYKGKQSNNPDIEPNVSPEEDYYMPNMNTDIPNCMFYNPDSTATYDGSTNNYRFYYLKVYETYKNNLLYHYVPYMKDGVIGIKELVNNKFYPLQGELSAVEYEE